MGNWRQALRRATLGIRVKRRRQRRLVAAGLVARGLGGRLSLVGNRLMMSKGGLFGLLATLLGFEGAFMERALRISQISAIEIDKPALFLRYMRISYPGAPQQTGNNLRDMMAENAILMSLFDNRPFYRIMARIEAMMDADG